jgi:hypothetical protein
MTPEQLGEIKGCNRLSALCTECFELPEDWLIGFVGFDLVDDSLLMKFVPVG